MFPSVMSPKMLNVEKLEKKFASLTRSRESIQGLSMWIIRHKDCYKEIVNQWLDALMRDFNALTMFYVANDVIQNCGRKKAPEYREAFATVLEKAVSLQKVKDIKAEVTRMLTLWHDRSIYDDEYFKKLQNILNSAVDDSESEKEEELSEVEVIEKFKLETVISSLRKVKTLEEELHEKESFLEDIEEPGMCNIDNLIVKMDSQKELRKFDKFQKLVEDCVSLTNKLIAAKKIALLNLKYSTIFYNAQMEDAKKVAHAYRIYGKKVKIVEKALLEKISTLPEPSPSPENSISSPCAELLSSQESQSSSVILNYSDKNGCEEVSLDGSISPNRIDNECEVNISDKKSKTVSEKIVSSLNTIISPKEEKKIDDEAKIQETLNSANENVAKESLSPKNDVFRTTQSTESSISQKTTDPESQILPDIECIDLLLETAYDNQVKSSKLSYKRKIDNLLKLKQAKTCKLADEDVNANNKEMPDIKNFPESGVPESQEKDLSSSVLQACPVEFKNEASKKPVTPKEKNSDIKSTNDTEKTSKFISSTVVDLESVPEKINTSPDIVTNVQNSSNEENVCNSKQSVKAEAPPEVQESNNNNLKKLSTSNSFTFQNFPDIPTELLKNILDKHRINMNLSTNADTPSVNVTATLNSASEPQNEANSSQDSNSNVTCERQSSVSDINDKSLGITAAEIKSPCQELLANENTSNVKKDAKVLSSSLSTTENIKNKEIKSTLFLENIQNLLEHFTKKETSLKELKSSKTSALSSMPLENTLRVFSCIMQSHNRTESVNNSSDFYGNAISAVPAGSLTKNETLQSVESSGSKTVTAGLFNKDEESAENFSINSKNDNLEIMDMEVDSDDENSG